jgi:hypothetical protein
LHDPPNYLTPPKLEEKDTHICKPITIEKIRTALSKTKYITAPGPDNIRYELLKILDDTNLTTIKKPTQQYPRQTDPNTVFHGIQHTCA